MFWFHAIIFQWNVFERNVVRWIWEYLVSPSFLSLNAPYQKYFKKLLVVAASQESNSRPLVPRRNPECSGLRGLTNTVLIWLIFYLPGSKRTFEDTKVMKGKPGFRFETGLYFQFEDNHLYTHLVNFTIIVPLLDRRGSQIAYFLRDTTLTCNWVSLFQKTSKLLKCSSMDTFSLLKLS